jgi:hypothetical protein
MQRLAGALRAAEDDGPFNGGDDQAGQSLGTVIF